LSAGITLLETALFYCARPPSASNDPLPAPYACILSATGAVECRPNQICISSPPVSAADV